jgi:hypothetical protein
VPNPDDSQRFASRYAEQGPHAEDDAFVPSAASSSSGGDDDDDASPGFAAVARRPRAGAVVSDGSDDVRR